MTWEQTIKKKWYRFAVEYSRKMREQHKINKPTSYTRCDQKLRWILLFLKEYFFIYHFLFCPLHSNLLLDAGFISSIAAKQRPFMDLLSFRNEKKSLHKRTSTSVSSRIRTFLAHKLQVVFFIHCFALRQERRRKL